MIRALVITENEEIDDHFEFESVPSSGDVIFIRMENKEYKLRVKLIEHYPPAKGDVMDPISSITIQCEMVTY